MNMKTRIKKELNILNRMITETNGDIMKMISLSAEAEMMLRKKNISEYEAEVMENKLFEIIAGTEKTDN